MSLHLEFKNVFFHYPELGGDTLDVLKDINLVVKPRECVALVGPSGSGKTTLLQHFTGLLHPSRGTVLVDGRDINQKGYALSQLRKRIGLVFQFPENQLFEETVYKDVAFGPKNMSITGTELDLRVRQALDLVDLDVEKFGSRSPFSLSEGEKRRVAIAGVLAMDPEVIVFDEPTAGLDPRSVNRVIDMINRLHEKDKSVIVITHSIDFVAHIAHRVIVLVDGKIVFSDTPESLFNNRAVLTQAKLDIPSIQKALQQYQGILPKEILESRTMQEFKTKMDLFTKL